MLFFTDSALITELEGWELEKEVEVEAEAEESGERASVSHLPGPGGAD